VRVNRVAAPSTAISDPCARQCPVNATIDKIRLC
jgi:hypothetical protein